jgi:THO complex subunit 2
LFVDSPLDAIILRELIAKMSGIEPLQILSDNQIMAMGGGPVLQIETVASESRGALQTKPLQRSSDKLLTALSNADLMLPMLLLLAQQCQQCVFKADTTDSLLKGVASTFDDVSVSSFSLFSDHKFWPLQLQGIFFQFITFLSLSPISQKPSSVKIRNEFFSKMPSLAEIVSTYGIEPTTVLHMCRTPIQRKIVVRKMVSVFDN